MSDIYYKVRYFVQTPKHGYYVKNPVIDSTGIWGGHFVCYNEKGIDDKSFIPGGLWPFVDSMNKPGLGLMQVITSKRLIAKLNKIPNG